MGTPRTPRVGEVIEGKYEILRRIGKGGMGIVYEARSLTLHRSVALKFLHPDMAENERLVERFQREARTAAAITHPCVTYVFDVGWTDDRSVPYMAMELLDGHSLAAEIRGSGALAPPRVVHIGARVLDALEAAHRLGVVHRDLKPENIFLARQGTQENVKVLDFGISKVLGGDSGATLTQTGAVLGTPAYMSPEQVKCARDVDHRADLYALGAVLYEMLAGQPAYQGESFTEVVYKIISDPPPLLSTLRPGLEPGLVGVVERAMHKDPSRRWQTAEAMRSALQQIAAEPGPGEVKPTPLAWELPSMADLSSAATVAKADGPQPEAATVAATPSRARTDPRSSAVTEQPAATLPAARTATSPGTAARPPSSRRALFIGVPLVALVGALSAGVALWARTADTLAPPGLTASPTTPAVTTTSPPPMATPPAVTPTLVPPMLAPPPTTTTTPPTAPSCRVRLAVQPASATVRLGAETYTGTVDLPAACGTRQSAHVEAAGHAPADVDLLAAADTAARELTLEPIPAPEPPRPLARPTPTTPRPRPHTPASDGDVHLEANPF